MKTIQIAYLENVESNNYMKKNVPSQNKSKFIRTAVAKEIELDKKKKKSSKVKSG